MAKDFCAASEPSPSILRLVLSITMAVYSRSRCSTLIGTFVKPPTPFTAVFRRSYAASAKPGSSSARKSISVLSDDGRIGWSELSGKEKVSRATQQSFNFVIVLTGAVLTVRFHCWGEEKESDFAYST